MRMLLAVAALLVARTAAESQVRSSAARSSPSNSGSKTSSALTDVTAIPVYNATVTGTPNDTTVRVFPDIADCNYTSDDDLYCFPHQDAFVSMTGWTRFFYNRNYGLINNSGLVDVTMHFAADDRPAASWIGVENRGDVPINVNISWFTSTLSPQATNSAADPYYFYVRPNSAVYNAYPTGSSTGPTFYAVQTPVQRLQVPVSNTATAGATPTTAGTAGSQGQATSQATDSNNNTTAANGDDGGLSRGAIAGIVIGAVALFFVLILLGIVVVLLLRRQRYAEEAAAAAARNNEEKRRHEEVVSGNLYTPAELAAAGGGGAGLVRPSRRRPSLVDQGTDSSGSVPMVIHQNPLARQVSLVRPERARVSSFSRDSPSGGGTWSDTLPS